MTDAETDATGQTRPDPVPVATPPRRRRPLRLWVVLATTVVVVALVVIGIGQVLRAVGDNAAGDPRSTRPGGAGALAQLLRDEGVDVVPANAGLEAGQALTADSTLVVIAPRLLEPERMSALVAARPARIVLVAPTSTDLARIGLDGVEVDAQLSQQTDPGCADPAAVRSGAIYPTPSPTYALSGGAVGCYAQDGGSAMVSTQLDGVPLIIIPTVISNETLPVAGNAALAMNVLGQHRQLVWLMARDEAVAADPGPGRPSLLPGWWPMLITQLLVGLVAVGLWRGRRLGPIIYEQLPVRIRSSETVEGHGRLYQRQEARGAAAAALRAAATGRLTSRYGHVGDPLALAETLAGRTGRPVAVTRTLLAGPDPVTDQQLLDLKIELDALQQEARHP